MRGRRMKKGQKFWCAILMAHVGVQRESLPVYTPQSRKTGMLCAN